MRLFLCRFPVLGGLRLFALLCAALVNVATANATTLVVTSTADSGAGSLRAALALANDGDTIQFDATLNGQTIGLTSGELVIAKNTTINGPGSNLLTVARSSGTFRIFHVMPGRSVIIGALTITGGNSGNGGGILNDHATLTVDSCKVQGNSAPGGFGGGIFNYGIGSSGATLTILNSTVSGNATTAGGGGIANDVSTGGSLTITNSVVTGNSASYADVSGSDGKGGGIYDIGGTATLRISDTTVSNNRAGPSAGAQFPGGYGGGIYHSSGTVIITNSTIAGNSVGLAGGGITSYGTLTITSSTVSGNSAFGTHDGQPTYSSGGGIDNNGTLTITNSTLSGNSAYSAGGGIGSGGVLTISNSTLSGNTANNGGGISTGTLEIGNTILKTGTSGANISGGTVTSHGYNLSSDNGGGFLTATGDQINTDPILGPLQNNGGPTFTHDLLSGSPASNAGDPNFTPPPLYDQRGFGYARVFNGRVDIGSLEVQAAFTPSPTPTATSTATPTATATATATASPTATATIAPTVTPTPMPGISGVVIYCTNPALNPVPGVTMTLTGTSGGSTTTGAAGNYSLTGLIYGGNYTVTPTKTALSPGSPNVSTVDVIATQRHFLVLGTPLTGCGLAAADVNGDSSVNTVDVVAIQRFYLGLSTGIANVGNYQFTPVSRTYTGITRSYPKTRLT